MESNCIRDILFITSYPGAYQLRFLFHKFVNWPHLFIVCLVLLNLVLHFSVIGVPDQVLFDEEYYVGDARLIIAGEGTERTEHPPLGKLFVAAGIFIFGDNPLGWRFFSVVAGAFILIFFYLICGELSLPRIATYLGTFILAFENITFIHASIAMLDVYSMVFGMGAFYLYLKGNYLATAVFAALSVLAKLNGALFVPVILIHWLIVRRDRPDYFIPCMALSPVFFFMFLPVFQFLTVGHWENPFQVTHVMLTATQSLTFATVDHEVQQAPWEWLIHHKKFNYWYKPDYFGNMSIQIWVLAIPAAVYMLFKSLWKNNAARFGFAWFTGTFLLWFPLIWVTDRVTYVFYVYPMVGAICLGLGLFFGEFLKFSYKFKRVKLRWISIGLVSMLVVGHLVAFVLVAPVFTRWF